jgi:hypothetical protein
MKFIILDVVANGYTALSRFFPIFDRNPKTFLGNNVIETIGVFRRII